MYNFLVTARSGAWDQPFYEFDKSRFLEYTTVSIAEAFKTLAPNLIETLKGYPCLFAYEGDEEELRIGILISIKERGRNLFIEFELDQNIPPIPFDAIKPIAPLLDIRDWEMNRTHWAVKDENLFERLVTAGILNQKQTGVLVKQEMPPVKESTNPNVTTVQEFIGKVLSSERENGSEVFYRGHSNKSKYKLEPSLFRKDNDGNYLYLENEHILYR
ncbi:hypothetical protein D3C79_526290 [compost metagenome]